MNFPGPQVSENLSTGTTSWPLSRYDYIGLALCGIGIVATLGMLIAGSGSTATTGFSHPFALGGQLIAIGISVVVIGDWLALRKAAAELQDFSLNEDHGRPVEYWNAVSPRDKKFHSMAVAEDAISATEAELRTNRYLYLLWPYLLALAAVPLFGFASGFAVLRRLETDPPPYSELYGQFFIATIEWFALAGCALKVSIDWNLWFMRWGAEVKRRFETAFAEEAKRVEAELRASQLGSRNLNGEGRQNGRTGDGMKQTKDGDADTAESGAMDGNADEFDSPYGLDASKYG